MTNAEFTTVQVQGITAEQLLQQFEDLKKIVSQLGTPPPPENDKLLTRHETAEFFGISLVTLYNWTRDGIVKAYRVGNKVRYRQAEVLESLKVITLKR
ncbi:hypothetical protein BWK59_02515 [Flavobacterium davisii]|uniref:Helix-turn-helix domain-containing protein n=1 Tax=Flavobacterium davisii TaxID=2906077 RepID=A0A246GKZ0_9FLAO|nr:helix-turn-helix domain-containing protein [Flavobacterium davisii]OWP84995.1 hypothetical protein BWK59_02515 [Flavobacterium davisii]